MAASERTERALLELILTGTHTSPSSIVDRLVSEFGSVPAAVSASYERLVQVADDRTADVIISVHGLSMSLLQSEIDDAQPSDTPAAIARYFTAQLVHVQTEEVHVAYMDLGSRIIRSEMIGRGSLTSAPLSPREIIRRGLELGASSLVVVHNHPSGDPEPSNSDIQVTRTLVAAGRLFNLHVADHIVVARRGWTSMCAKGLM